MAVLPAQFTITGSIMSGGIERTYRLYVPEIYDAQEPVPLVINLHGYGSDSQEQELYGDFRPIADTANFLVVHPDGTLDAQNLQYWNSFGLAAVDDVAFLSELIDTLSAAYSIDPDCVYSTGMSNGGFMSYELACQLSNRIAAIASVTGSMTLFGMVSCNALHPTPVMQIHGTEDATVPYEGSFGVSSIDNLVTYWVEFNNCSLTPTFTAIPDIATNDGCTAEHYVYNGGNGGSTVELYKILEGDHSWPGAIFNINTTNMDFDASTEIWRFFSQYKLDELSTVEALPSLSRSIVYPNPAHQHFTLLFQDEGDKMITVANALGETIMQLACNDASVDIQLESCGLYIISVSNGKERWMKKVVME